MLTGTEERYIEKPAITPTPATPATKKGTAAPDAHGKKDKNTIQNFFNRFIALSIPHFETNVI
jgi:hypothetical protein